MANYLFGEAYRIIRKKSMYLYFGAFAFLYLLLVFMRAGTGNADTQILQDAEVLSSFFPAVVGGYLFAAIYTDDLNAKNLGTLIGFGMGKAKIVIAKLVLVLAFGALFFGLIPLFLWAANTLFGGSIPSSAWQVLYAWAAKSFLETLAFSAVSAIVVYGLQRATFGMVTYLLLALGIISQLMSALLNWDMISSVLPGLSQHLMSGISFRVMVGIVSESMPLEPLVEYLVYVAAAAALSVLAFRKKELEF
ncbi:MAG: hypothetical protein LBG81_03295 [Coriobacteriaceae bacterium]|jgi:hypothetical protein|nr:hypothetical protein [Coriobacteriaceae bacterium]